MSNSARIDPIRHLVNERKWQLSDGRMLIFSPRFPAYLNSPGFWDEIGLVDVELPHGFTVSLLDKDLHPVELQSKKKCWQPDRMDFIHAFQGGKLDETRVVVDGVLASHFTLIQDEPGPMHALVWCVLPTSVVDGGVVPDEEGENLLLELALKLNSKYGPEGQEPVCAQMAIGSSPSFSSYSVKPSEMSAGVTTHPPNAYLSPFLEELAEGKLSNRFTLAQDVAVTYLAGLITLTPSAHEQQFKVVVQYQLIRESVNKPLPTGDELLETHKTEEEVIGELDLPDDLLGLQTHVVVGNQDEETLQSAGDQEDGQTMAVAPDPPVLFGEAHELIDTALSTDLCDLSACQWRAFFDAVPYFACSDAHLQKFYWYRWFGLRLMRADPKVGHHNHPFVYEGPTSLFRYHISYSVQAHVHETRWFKNSDWTWGCLQGIFDHQLDDGMLPSRVGVNYALPSIYHASWGRAALAAYAVSGDKEWLRRVYPSLHAYFGYLKDVRSADGSMLVDVWNHWETGQEYSRRYQEASPDADQWVEIRLKGIDASTYFYELARALALISEILEEDSSVAREYNEYAERIKVAIKTYCRDPSMTDPFYFDSYAGKLSPIRVKAAVGFYPFMSDLADKDDAYILDSSLLSSADFWTAFPVPSLARSDPSFSSTSEWKGARRNCAWNGRVWPMLNSHIIEALCNWGRAVDRKYLEWAGEMLYKTIRMMFYTDTAEFPNSLEHYNPHTGAGSAYRGIDDYQHSWIVDLYVTKLAGIEPMLDSKIVVDPLDFGLKWFELRDAWVKGHRVTVTWNADGLDAAVHLDRGMRVFIDDHLVFSSPKLTRWEGDLRQFL